MIFSLTVIGFIGYVIAYDTNEPVSFGHSSGEVEGTVPAGAIMVFNLQACPPGWSEVVEARGRVIAGLDSGDTDFDSLEMTGGEKEHTP